MSTYKRVAGNLVVQTVGATDTVTFQGLTANAATIIIDGNLTVTGNAALTGNISGDNIFNGTTSISIPAPNGNANITIGGTSNVAVFSTGGANITGYVSASGNVTGANLITAGLATVTGNVTGANLNTAGNVWISRDASAGQPTIRFTDTDADIADGQVFGAVEWFTSDVSSSGPRVTAGIRAVAAGLLGNANVQILTSTGGAAATPKVTIDNIGNVGIANLAPLHTLAVTGTVYGSSTLDIVGNITGGNLTTAGRTSVTGNVVAGNVTTVGLITATGNITGGNLITAGLVSAGATGITATGNVRGGNVVSDAQVSATGNVYAGGNLTTQGNVSATGNLIGATVQVANANVSGSMFGTGIGVENTVWQDVAATISSASMANVGILQFAALANQSYKFQAMLPTVPDGATTTAFSMLFSSGACNYVLETQTTAASAWAVASSNTSDSTGTTQAMTGTTLRTVRITGTFYNTANTDVVVRAQTSAANLTVLAGASLTYTRIG
jgi:filamentous hemagglutinin